MGTENTSGLLPTSLLPKGPFPFRVPPKPQPRRERCHVATDTVTVLNRNTCTGEAGDHGQEKGQLTRIQPASSPTPVEEQGASIGFTPVPKPRLRVGPTPAEEQWASIGFTPVPKPRLRVRPTPAEEQWASIGFTPVPKPPRLRVGPTPAEEQGASIGFTPVPKPRLRVRPTPAEEQGASIGFIPVPKPRLRVGPTPAEEQWASIGFTPVPKPRLRVGPTPAEEQWASIGFTPVPKPRLRVGPTLNPHSRDSGLVAGHMEEPLCLRTNPVQRLPPPNKLLPTLKINSIVQRMVHMNTENRNIGYMVVIDTEGSVADLHYTQLPRGSQERLNTAVTDKLKANCREKNGLLETLWQERRLVQESGILPYLNKQELLLQESMYEVVTTEQSYLERLGVAVNHFMKSSTLRLALSPRDHKSLFSSIAKIREISQKFLDAMKKELESNLLCDMLCDVIHRHTSSHFGAYVDYIRNMPYQEQTMHNLGRENPQIMEILRKLQDDQRCYRLPLKSFLVLPFQRITRLKILIENILKSTERGSERQASAEKALRALIKVVEACNREVGRMKMMEEIVHIANKTEFECKALPLVSSSRWLVRQGQLAQLSEKENIFGHRKLCHIYLFLFNDLLLVTTRKSMDRFVVRDHVHRSLIEVSEGLEEKEDLVCASRERMFCLALLKNQRGTTSQFLLQASTQAEKITWMEVLSRREDGMEGIYEEWDCPQVRCTEVYVAQQPGELSIQLGDTINVIQKTTDGFLEGRRLVDGERGWFPDYCAVQVTNEYIQRKHLRQRYHVLKTANRILNRRQTVPQATACFR
eukprot:XP_013979190.1 PREDICTED: ephexin-1-like isoform X2 [Salmo salar]